MSVFLYFGAIWKHRKKFKDITTDNNGHKIQLSLQIHFNVCSLDEFSMNVNKDLFNESISCFIWYLWKEQWHVSSYEQSILDNASF